MRLPNSRTMLIRLVEVTIVAIVLTAWWVVGSSSKTERLTVSTPGAVLSWLGHWVSGSESSGWSDLWTTVEEALVGTLLGMASGILIAGIFSLSDWTRAYIAPLANVVNAIPKIALAPLFILIFGPTLHSKVYFVALIVCFISFYNVFNGLRTIDPRLLNNVRVLGAGHTWQLREVYIPAIFGWVVASTRLSISWGLAGAVVAEYIGSTGGMGYVIALGQQTDVLPQVIGGIIIVGLAAVIADVLIVQVDRHVARWRSA